MEGGLLFNLNLQKDIEAALGPSPLLPGNELAISSIDKKMVSLKALNF